MWKPTANHNEVSYDSFLCPNFKEVEEAYWFGPVCLSVTLYALHTVKNA